nr:SusC/RagA family TonB-linked outer membrane protein [Duncaniella sp.]
MKKNRKAPSSGLSILSDRTLACSALTLCLMCGTAMTTWAADAQAPQSAQQAATQRISGTVVDELGEPMAGVSIVEKGSKNGVATDLDGNFSLNVRRGTDLTFSYIGYKPQTVKIGSQTTLDIKMEPDENMLDEVVTIGYGTVKKRDLTGAVSSVKNEDITLSPTSNAMDALQGKVAGLDITRSSGQAGATPAVQLRGTRSFTAEGTPTYIIDGMPGDVNTINPNDIESIEVLKDASSTAIYGSAGANGIIIVTTKSGKEGRTVVNFNAYVGVNGWSTVPKVFDSKGFYDLRAQSIKAGGGSTDPINVLGNAYLPYQNALDANPNLSVDSWLGANSIDWTDALLKTGVTQNYSISVSGGTEKTKAYFSLNFSDEQGQYSNDNNKIYSTNIRIDHKLRNWLDIGVNLQGSYTYRNSAYAKLEGVLKQSPIGSLYDADGNVNISPVAGSDTPSLLLNNHDNYRNNYQQTRIYFNPYIRVTPIKGLTWESRVNASLIFNTHNQFQGEGSYLYYNASTIAATGPNANVWAKVTQDNYVNYKWENILTYTFDINKIHNFTVTGVTSWNHNRQSELYGEGTNISSNSYLWHNLSEGEANLANTLARTNYIMSKGMGLVGRINYSFAGKYLASVSVRHDGSSRLADGNRWDTFPAFSLGWRISDEAFMDRLRDKGLENLKIRVGYGVTGTASIAPYSSFSSFIPGMTILGDGVSNTSYFTQNIANLALTWEKSKSWNFGVDASLLKGRLEVTADYYRTNTEGVIYGRNVPVTSGAFDASKFYTTNVNVCQTLNNGIELAVTGRPFIERHPGDFSWTINATFTANHEKITRLTTPDQEYITNGDGGNVYYKGYPVNSYYHYKLLGTWTNAEEADAAVFGCKPGDLKVFVPDMNHDGPGKFSRWEEI